jgi:hypothetical protein
MIEADHLKVFFTEAELLVFLSIEEEGETTAQPGLTTDEAIDLATDLLNCALALKRRIQGVAK